MPKSSRTSRTPSSLSASRVDSRVADSSTRTLSVISRRRWTGSRPVRASTSATDGGEVAVGDLAGGEVDGDVERARVGAQLVPVERSGGRPLRTQRPIGSIRPLSSAIGMNSAGSSRPRSGWRQRTSASRPVISPVAGVTTGW